MNHWIRHMLKSPLLHFFAIAIIVYVGTEGIKHSGLLSLIAFGDDENVITLTQAELTQIQRESSKKFPVKNLAASIDTLVDNELLFKEGLKLGLASNDAIIIDRMVKNIKYVSQQQVDQKKCTTHICFETSDSIMIDSLDDHATTLEEQDINEADLKELFAEARSLNLFENDPVIHRRVIQLAEQHLRQDRIIGKPSENELRAYMSRNNSDFMLPKRWSIEQIYFNPTLHTVRLNEILAQALTKLKNTGSSVNNLGDATILPKQVEMASERQLVQQFGADFAKAIADAPLNGWSGPIESAFGSHFVRVSGVRDENVAELNSVYNRAFIGWLEEQKKNVYHDHITRLREQYKVSVEGYAAVAATNFSSYWLRNNNVNWQ